VIQVLVVGSGIAGTAAALAASRAGARVTMIALGPGASSLAGGALDLAPWDAHGEAAPDLEEDALAVVDALDAFDVRGPSRIVATLAGILRPARGVDRALLDLGPLHDATVWVPSVDWPRWDAPLLARFWSDSAEAGARRLVFMTAPAHMIERSEELAMAEADMAALHDSPARIAWLASRLEEGKKAGAPAASAVLLPPWLGLERSRAEALALAVGVPCGEAMSGPGGPSGLRFERARDRALAASGVERVLGQVTSLAYDGAWRATLAGGAGGEPLAAFDAVVLATGGLLGGGLAYRPMSGALAADPRAAAAPLLTATLDAPLLVGMRGAPLRPPSSLFGGAPESHAWPFAPGSLLERGGVLVEDEGRVRGAPRGLLAAGEFAADAPRTWLSALSTGARAGRAAAGA
jgi:glycerol-3-phosphate dehydrogenase subunit B